MTPTPEQLAAADTIKPILTHARDNGTWCWCDQCKLGTVAWQRDEARMKAMMFDRLIDAAREFDEAKPKSDTPVEARTTEMILNMIDRRKAVEAQRDEARRERDALAARVAALEYDPNPRSTMT